MTSEKSPTTAALGLTIREARRKHHWSQTDLAENAGVSRPTVARVERGDDVSTATLAKVAVALGLSVVIEGEAVGSPLPVQRLDS